MTRPPTRKQLHYLRSLAEQTGTTFSPPASSAEASEQIKALQRRPTSLHGEDLADRNSVAQRGGANDGTAVNDDEIRGFGSSARWAAGER